MTSCHLCGHTDEGVFLFCPRCGTRAASGDEPEDTLVGRTLNGKYRVEAEIGAGAMGTVYLAEHVGLKKKVALKVLHPDLQVSDESLRRFQREGIAAGKFNHPNLIQIFDFDKGEGRLFYLAMEYVQGSNLKVYLRRKGRLDPDKAMRIARQILSCLAEAHRHGIIHRDLKPDNLMITSGPGGGISVKVLDFGLSKLVDRRADASLVTQQGRILGTPLYMAPEQCAGDEADARSDIYAMGLILYEIVTGLRPFPEESTTELLFTRATKEAPSILEEFPELEIPLALDKVISKAMERRREDRFQSADEMLSALNEIRIDPSTWGAGSTIMTSTATLQRLREKRRAGHGDGDDAAPPERGRRWPLLLAALGAVVVAALLLLYFTLPGPMDARLVSGIPEARRTVEQSLYVNDLEDARAYLREGNFDAAEREVENAMERGCADAEVHLVKGEIYYAREDWDSAQASYDLALQQDPGLHQAHLGRGWVEYARGAFEASLECFRAAEEIVADDPEVLVGMGAASRRTGYPAAAESYLEAACELDPENARAQLFRGLLALDFARIQTEREKRRTFLEEATAALVGAKVSDSGSEEVKRALVEVYLEAGDLEQAERELAETKERFGTLESYSDLATLHLDAGRAEEARTLLEEGLGRYPHDAALAVLHGAALAELGRGVEAIDELERGLGREPHDPEATLLLGTLYQRNGMIQPAIEKYNKVRELVGEHPVANFELGVAYFQTKRYLEARDAFRRSIEFGSASGLQASGGLVAEADAYVLEAHKNLGILHMNYLGGDEASFYLRRYQELGGTDARVDDWLRRLGG